MLQTKFDEAKSVQFFLVGSVEMVNKFASNVRLLRKRPVKLTRSCQLSPKVEEIEELTNVEG